MNEQDTTRAGDVLPAEEFGADILKLCVEVGGCLTGEHGVGAEKRDLMEPSPAEWTCGEEPLAEVIGGRFIEPVDFIREWRRLASAAGYTGQE